MTEAKGVALMSSYRVEVTYKNGTEVIDIDAKNPIDCIGNTLKVLRVKEKKFGNQPVGIKILKQLLFKSQILSYSEYKWLGDMKLPAAGADIILHGTHYSFCTIIKLKSGNEVLADVMHTVRHEPKVVGKLS